MSHTKQTRRVTPASSETLLTLLETLPSALFVVDDAATIVSANASAQALIGGPPEEIIGKPLAHILWWSGSQAGQEQVRAAIARASQGETAHFETMIHPREGRDRDLEVTITRHVDADYHRAYLVFAAIDITAHKRTDEAIPALIDAIPQFVWIMDPDGSAHYSNQRWGDYTGRTLEHIHGDGWLQFIHPEDRPRVQEAWQTAVRTGTPYEVEHRIQQGSTGDYRWFLARSLPHIDAQGAIVRWVGTCTDIEEQKRTEEALRQSREELRILMETMPQLVWIARPDGFLEYGNQHDVAYLNVPLEQFNGDQWLQFVHPEDRQKTWTTWQTALRTGQSHEVEYRLREGKTGNYQWFLVRGTPFTDEQGRILKWFGTCTNIDEQKRIEEALRQSQERIRALIDSNIIGIASNEGEEEVIVEANDAWLHMTGYTREDVRSRTLTRVKITPAEQAPLFERALQELAAHGQHTPIETELVCKDGSRLPILAGGVTFQDRPRQIVAFVLDNSARKELEGRKDAFIGMASHELRNPLTALKLQTSLLHRQLAKQGIQASVPALSRMETQINTITRLVEELLDVSKIQSGKLEYRQETVDLDALLREIADTMQQSHPSHSILLHGAVRASLLADRDRLEQVFTNLLSNAIKYSPDAQTVEMDLSSSPETVTIRVRDHGLGIPREQRDKIFERFYRAAGPKQRVIPGLGMGLYIVAEIIKHHGGTIMVESAVGKGSTFTVTLPLTRDG